MGFDPNNEPPVDPLDDTNPTSAFRPTDEPPIDPLDDTNPSAAIQESPVDPLADTNPTITVPVVMPLWRRAVGVLSLLGAVGFTVATVLLLMLPGDTPPPTPLPDVAEAPDLQPTETVLPPTARPTDVDVVEIAQQADSVAALPTISAEQAAALLQNPPEPDRSTSAMRIIRNAYQPFTLIPDRPRGEVIQYLVERGDTIYSISERFGLEPESVVWANSRDIVGLLPPGEPINIVPENGVYHLHTGSSTVADIANQYGVDPYDIIDSEYNPALRGLEPDSVPPSGTRIMVVGGEAEQINWNPTVVREGGEGGSGSGGNFITFAPGDPGSCGRVANPGGGAAWRNPMANYTWMRGFTSFHTGVDLSASEGTPVYAANGGRVVFAGWNNWGYGYTVVLAHGPFTTLYGHLSSVTAGCGQDVQPGTLVGLVGNTGNSSGPHLHFEIRFNDVPQDPTLTIPF